MNGTVISPSGFGTGGLIGSDCLYCSILWCLLHSVTLYLWKSGAYDFRTSAQSSRNLFSGWPSEYSVGTEYTRPQNFNYEICTTLFILLKLSTKLRKSSNLCYDLTVYRIGSEYCKSKLGSNVAQWNLSIGVKIH